jgi:hypothetical protein
MMTPAQSGGLHVVPASTDDSQDAAEPARPSGQPCAGPGQGLASGSCR